MQIFLLIWVITHINYYGLTQHYSLTRGWFGERVIETYFRSLRTLVFFFYKIRESISTLYQGFFQTDIKFLQMPRTNDSSRQNMSVVELFIEIFK